jgi:PncC family amidohydrolase
VKDIAQKLHKYLYGSDETCAVAESCTGGAIADAITDIAGCSDYFLFGTVAYANTAKTDVLGVSEKTITEHGAVSAEVAVEMAAGAVRICRATYGVSTTGIAGPTGATPGKPVGLVYIGLAWPGGVRALRYEFEGDRRQVKEQAARAALESLVNLIRGLRNCLESEQQ